MNFKEKIKDGKFVVTLEVEPPKGNLISDIIDKIKPLKDKIDAYNVTDMQSSIMRMSSWAMAIKLKENGFEPILQLTCRDRNILALQGDLLGASLFGIENLLLLTGDNPSCGDHPEAKAVFDLNSVKLINLTRNLNIGFDASDNKLKGKPNFFMGAALNPFNKDVGREIGRLGEKINAGASFFQTQPIFDVDKFYQFAKKANQFKAKIIAGVILVKNYRSAKFLNDNIEGINIPDIFLNRLKEATNFKAEMVKLIHQIVNDLKSLSCGVHIMPLGWYDMAAEVLP